MTEEKNPYLAGCVFYMLLRKAAYTGTTARQRRDGIKDDHKNPLFMSDLVYTFTGTQAKIAASDISVYREGNSEGTGYMPFNDPSDISSYNHVVRNRYADALKRMCEFTEWHLNPDKREWFVKACLDIIENDTDIMESDEFCIKSNGTFVSKAEIRNETTFEYQPFLVGVLHFILTKRAGKNHLGVQTLDANTTKKKSKERTYSGHLGDGITRNIIVNMYNDVSDEVLLTPKSSDMARAETELATEADVILEKTDNEVIRDHIAKTAQTMATILGSTEMPKANVDVLENGISTLAKSLNAQKHQLAEQIRAKNRQDDSTSETQTSEAGKVEEPTQETYTDKKTTIIQQQTNVIQNGNNDVNITNNGRIDFNF